MTAIEIPVSIGLPPPKSPRSKGIHLSNVIRCIAQEQGILKPDWMEDLNLVDVREITDPVALLKINIGLAWEEHYIPMLPEVEDHPKELEVAGLFMSPDGESTSVIITQGKAGLRTVVHEVKATYYSTRTIGNLSNAWMWLTQIKGYCKGLNTRFAMLHGLFLCGDYSMPIQPKLKCWQIEFTQEEIDENWDLIISYRDERLKSA